MAQLVTAQPYKIVRDTIYNDPDGKMNMHCIQIKLNLIFTVICQGRFNRLTIWQGFQTNLEIRTFNCLDMHDKFPTYPEFSILTLSVAIRKKSQNCFAQFNTGTV